MLLLLAFACFPYHTKSDAPTQLAGALDDDADGITADADLCPRGREDMDGFEDADGCPDADNDQDGFVDVRDACPMEAGGVEWQVDSKDGCPPPPPDTDGDGILDADDACPEVPETVNGFKDKDGCPDKKIEITEKSIDFEGTVEFEFGSAKLSPVSDPLLKDLAQIMKEHPEILLVEVGGHTDDVGNNAANKKLSQARADAVKARLVELGVEPGRLEAKGYGEERPKVKATTEEARAQNRRVELVIKKKLPSPGVPQPPAGGDVQLVK